MACAVRTRGQTCVQVVDAAKKERAHLLREFAQATSVLRTLLYDDRALDAEELIFMDKSFQLLHVAYLRWKRVRNLTDRLPQ
jgi:hypothetical protein